MSPTIVEHEHPAAWNLDFLKLGELESVTLDHWQAGGVGKVLFFSIPQLGTLQA